jgi:hypothetical protein
VAGDFRQVFEPFAQRRQHDRHHVEAVVEVLAEVAGVDRRFEVAMSGGDQPYVELQRPAAADTFQFALLQTRSSLA